jgi:hypothetical protein
MVRRGKITIREWWEVGCEVAVEGTSGQANGRGGTE